MEADLSGHSMGAILGTRSVVDLETDLSGQLLGEPIHGGRSDEECLWEPIHGGRSIGADLKSEGIAG